MYLRPQGRVQLSDPAEKGCHPIQYTVHPVHTTLFYLIHLSVLSGAAWAPPAHLGLFALCRCTRVPMSRHLYGSSTYRQISVAGLTAFGYLARDSTIGKNGSSARYASVFLSYDDMTKVTAASCAAFVANCRPSHSFQLHYGKISQRSTSYSFSDRRRAACPSSA